MTMPPDRERSTSRPGRKQRKILALLVGFWFFAFGPGQGTFGGSTSSNSGTDINVNVDLPSGEPASS